MEIESQTACLTEADVFTYLQSTPRISLLTQKVESHLPDCSLCRTWIAELVRSQIVPPGFDDPLISEAMGRYQLIEFLGAGGMGIVYRAHDNQLERDVAIKFIKATSVSKVHKERLTNEAMAMAKISHPNTVNVFEVCVHDNEMFIVMEFVDGQTLREWGNKDEPKWNVLIGYCIQAARGISEAHLAGIIHNDIKPDNLLLGKDGFVRVADFGLSNIGTDTRIEGGTTGFLAPEILQGKKGSEQSDQYSLAQSIKHMLCSLSESPPRRTLSRLKKILDKATSVHINDRYNSVEDFSQKLANVSSPVANRYLKLIVPLQILAITLFLVFGINKNSTTQHLYEPCIQRTRKITEFWTPDKRALSIKNISSAGPLGTGLASTTPPYVDSYVKTWNIAFTKTCHAQIDTPLESKLMRKMNCLSDIASQLYSALRMLGDEDAEKATWAAENFFQLPPVLGCQNGGPVTIPEDIPKKHRERFQQAWLEISQLTKLIVAQKNTEALAKLTAISEEVSDIDYLPLKANIENYKGQILMRLGKTEKSKEALLLSIEYAEQGGDDNLRAKGYLELIQLHNLFMHAPEEAIRWSNKARPIIKRMGDDVLLSFLDEKLGILLLSQDTQASIKYFSSSLALRRKVYPPAHPQVAHALRNLGSAYVKIDKIQQGEKLQRESLAMFTKAYGQNHTYIAWSKLTLAETLQKKELFDESLTTFQEARQILTNASKSQVPTRAYCYIQESICKLRIKRKEYDLAITECTTWQSMLEKLWGINHAESKVAKTLLETLKKSPESMELGF